MKITRLFSIILTLLHKNGVTAGYLAEKYEVSVRTIYRDIDVLSYSGIPVYCHQGSGGGIFLDKSFVLNKSLFSKKEQEQLLDALHLLSQLKSDAKTTLPLLDKLSSFFKHSTEGWVELDFSNWNPQDSMNDRQELLKEAIISSQAVVFSYVNSLGETCAREVYPLKILFKERSWYLRGFCLQKKEYRVFKLSRIQELELLEKKFEKTLLPEYKTSSNYISSPLPQIHIEIQLSSEMGFRVYDEFSKSQITNQEDGSFKVEFDCPDDFWLLSYLLSFGDHITILRPHSVREKLIQMTKNFISKNQT